jgi:hypothetical protein
MTVDRTANSFGHAPNLPGVEFTWSEFVRATQIARTQYSDRPLPAMTAGVLRRIHQALPAWTPLHGRREATCWYCAHPVDRHSVQHAERLQRDRNRKRVQRAQWALRATQTAVAGDARAAGGGTRGAA